MLLPIYKYDWRGKLLAGYSSTTEAARSIECDESSIRKRVDTGKLVGGFLWSRFKDKENKTPKILLLDIETSFMKAAIWKLYKNIITSDMLLSEWFMLSWAAKWLYSETVMSRCLNSKEALEEFDFNILVPLWDLLDEADIIVAHNAKRFDIKRINTRFIIHDLLPPKTYKMIDTLEVIRQSFAFPSNGLGFVNNMLKIPGKMDNSGMDLWKGCVSGDTKSLREMEEYNKQDVVALEQLYLKVRPWIKSHPNTNVYTDIEVPVCASCASKSLVDSGFFTTQSGKYQQYRCLDCGSYSRERCTVLTKGKRKAMLVSIPK